MLGSISLVICLCVIADDQSSELKRYVEMHRTARQSINSLHCIVEMKATELKSPLNLTGTFWKNGSDYRYAMTQHPTSMYADRKQDAVYRDGKLEELVTSRIRNREEIFLIRLERPIYQEFGNPFWWGLMYFSGLGQIGPFTLEEMVADGKFKVDSFKIKQEGKYEKVILKLRHAVGYYEFTMDSQYNYLVTQFVQSVQNDKIKSVHSVSSFEEISPGVYFPVSIQLSNRNNDIEKEKVTTKITIKSGNKPVDMAAIKLNLPATNIKCKDKIRNEFYYVNNHGDKIGPFYDKDWKPIKDKVVAEPIDRATQQDTILHSSEKSTKPDTVSSYNADKPQSYTTATATEPKSWAYIITIGSIVMIAFGVLIIGYRRFISYRKMQ